MKNVRTEALSLFQLLQRNPFFEESKQDPFNLDTIFTRFNRARKCLNDENINLTVFDQGLFFEIVFQFSDASWPYSIDLSDKMLCRDLSMAHSDFYLARLRLMNFCFIDYLDLDFGCNLGGTYSLIPFENHPIKYSAAIKPDHLTNQFKRYGKAIQNVL